MASYKMVCAKRWGKRNKSIFPLIKISTKLVDNKIWWEMLTVSKVGAEVVKYFYYALAVYDEDLV